MSDIIGHDKGVGEVIKAAPAKLLPKPTPQRDGLAKFAKSVGKRLK